MDIEAVARKTCHNWDFLKKNVPSMAQTILEWIQRHLDAAGVPEMEKRLEKAEKLGMAAAVLLGRLCVLNDVGMAAAVLLGRRKDSCDHCPSDVRELCRATHEQEG